ncbi:MAG: hypothetical protein JSU63_07390 [Phycisphaerales bacterium]|nr:MAG: hypothetical protein JSU63_07390 [Phycisphaerales bacterium]
MIARRHIVFGIVLTVAALGAGGCFEFFANQSASLGGDIAGVRGNVRVLFINNTDYRAVFTYGSYDQTDPAYGPDYEQSGLTEPDVLLEGGESTSITPGSSRAFIECARVFSVGSEDLLELIRQNLPDDDFLESAMVEGVEFFEIPAEDEEDSPTEPISRGAAPPFEALLGVDFPCNALLIIRFEIDDFGPNPFRIDFEMIPSDSDR